MAEPRYLSDSAGHHPTGQHALWRELCQARAALAHAVEDARRKAELLRQGKGLVEALERGALDADPELYARARLWRVSVEEVLE